jgi:parallel beta-helix repeat protein
MLLRAGKHKPHDNGPGHKPPVPVAVVYGPQQGVTQPPGSVAFTPGDDSSDIQSAVTVNAAGTTFWFPAGTYSFAGVVTPKSNQSFVGEYGAILDGTGWTSLDLDDGFFRSVDNGVTGVTIRNLVIRNGPCYGVNSYISASDWTVIHCEIANNLTGVSVGTAGIISHNSIHHNVGNAGSGNPAERGGGITLGGSQGAQIIYNEIAYNGVEQKCAASGTGLNQDIYIAHNWYHHNDGNGIWNDGDGEGTIIENNIVEDNGTQGITTEYSNLITVRNNTIRRSGSEGLYVTITKNGTFTGNLIEHCPFGIHLFLDAASLFPNSAQAAWEQDLADNTVSGNTVHALTGQKLGYFSLSNKGLGGISPTPYETNTKNNDWSSNTYFAPDTTGNWFFWDGVNKTFTTWQALPQDAGSSITAE